MILNARTRDEGVLSPTSEEPRKVRILDDVVVNQIAAGEVVERPSSVVKELIENSIDAGATEISVSITNGGKTSIEVLDNGSGMGREDALFAVERFGTSKIRSVEDLEKISSHGFRGEALPSIASVSRFSLETAPWQKNGDNAEDKKGEQNGTEILIDGGKLIEVRSKPLPPGTKVTVRNLFFNVPARKKFLRSESTEEGLIRSQLVDFASAYPHIRIRLSSDGVERATLLPGEDFYVKAKQLKVAGERPILVDYRQATAAGPVIVRAVLSQPIECVSQSGRLRLLINRRSVRDKLLLKAIRDGYGAYLRPGRYPMGVISVELPPEDVDVNVHPQKSEVRFRRPELIFQTIVGGLKNALNSSTSLPTGSSGSEGMPESVLMRESQARANFQIPGSGAEFKSAQFQRVEFIPGERSDPQLAVPETMRLFSKPPTILHGELYRPDESIKSEESRAADESIRNMRYVGQVLACFLIFEAGEIVAVMDMHAAHERVMFFRLKQQMCGGALHSQQLLIPEVIDFGGSFSELVEKNIESLQKLGFEIDRLTASAVSLRAVPSLLASGSGKAIISDLMSEPEFSDWSTLLGERVDAVLARMACHRSIRSGRILDAKEAYALVEALEEADTSGLCPHGRPTVKFLRKYDFEAMFGRVL